MPSDIIRRDWLSFGVFISIASLLWYVTSQKKAKCEVKYKWTDKEEDNTPICTVIKYIDKIKHIVLNVPSLTSDNVISILSEIAVEHFNIYYDCFLLMTKLKHTANEEDILKQMENLFNDKSFQSQFIAAKIKILEKYETDLDTFESCLINYLENPDILFYTEGIEAMQEDVLNNLPPLMPGAKLDINLQGERPMILWNKYLELKEFYAKQNAGLLKPDVDFDFYKILNEAHIIAEKAFLKKFEVPSMHHLKHSICLCLRFKPESIHELQVMNKVHLDKMSNIARYVIDFNYSNEKFEQF